MIFCQIDRELLDIIEKHANGKVVVDCGCGDGLLGSLMKEVISIDMFPKETELIPDILYMDAADGKEIYGAKDWLVFGEGWASCTLDSICVGICIQTKGRRCLIKAQKEMIFTLFQLNHLPQYCEELY